MRSWRRRRSSARRRRRAPSRTSSKGSTSAAAKSLVQQLNAFLTVESIYRHFRRPWDATVRDAVAAEDAAGRTGTRAPAHRHSRADFSLTTAEVDERFADYTGRYVKP